MSDDEYTRLRRPGSRWQRFTAEARVLRGILADQLSDTGWDDWMIWTVIATTDLLTSFTLTTVITAVCTFFVIVLAYAHGYTRGQMRQLEEDMEDRLPPRTVKIPWTNFN